MAQMQTRSRPCLALLLLACLAVGPGLAWTAEHEVIVRNFEFVPRDLTIAPGDTVIWRSVEGVHNVVADDGSFSSGAPRTGFTFQHTFNTPGENPY